MNKRNVYIFSVGMMLMVIAVFSQAAELNLNSRGDVRSELRDGEIIATGRIACREVHDRFHIWVNTREDKRHPGHYLVRGEIDSLNEIRVRLGGKGWVPASTGQGGMERPGGDSHVIFDVLVDGRQHVAPDEYVFSVTGTCYNRG
ncbi:adhesin [Escherichia coli]